MPFFNYEMSQAQRDELKNAFASGRGGRLFLEFDAVIDGMAAAVEASLECELGEVRLGRGEPPLKPGEELDVAFHIKAWAKIHVVDDPQAAAKYSGNPQWSDVNHHGESRGRCFPSDASEKMLGVLRERGEGAAARLERNPRYQELLFEAEERFRVVARTVAEIVEEIGDGPAPAKGRRLSL